MSESTTAVEHQLTEIMTWEEICRRYPNQWVALVDMDMDDDTLEFTVARVAGYGHTRKAPFDMMRSLGLGLEHGSVGHFYTGPIVAHAIPFVR